MNECLCQLDDGYVPHAGGGSSKGGSDELPEIHSIHDGTVRKVVDGFSF